MSVAPRGSRVWQPPTVWIMYCSFNHPTISNYLPQSVHTQYFALQGREYRNKCKRYYQDSKYLFPMYIVYYTEYSTKSPLCDIACLREVPKQKQKTGFWQLTQILGQPYLLLRQFGTNEKFLKTFLFSNLGTVFRAALTVAKKIRISGEVGSEKRFPFSF